jgi:hypothetical protein
VTSVIIQEKQTGKRSMGAPKNSTASLTLLSDLLLCGDEAQLSERLPEIFSTSNLQTRQELWELATTHHVIMRAFSSLRRVLSEQTEGTDLAEWANDAVAKEQIRIDHALSFLAPICEALETAADVMVIKSLDHWPDLGSDLDLYTNAKSSDVMAVMCERFHARPAKRSWGDRLANKWNFIVPGLPELVEVHIGRLGQTGEQVALTNGLVARAGLAQFGPHTFRVPAPEDRVIISTLQRMYRHFYLRLCDIADNACLVESGAIDYVYLESLARPAGLWEGLATYLVMVSDYIKSYRGRGLALPSAVRSMAARFENKPLSFRRKFLRVPIFPHAASFYTSEWKKLLLNGEFQNTLRLSLLPGLAAAAVLELKLSRSDKGIW